MSFELLELVASDDEKRGERLADDKGRFAFDTAGVMLEERN